MFVPMVEGNRILFDTIVQNISCGPLRASQHVAADGSSSESEGRYPCF